MKAEMVTHNKACICESITAVADGCDIDLYEDTCVQNFRNVLLALGDKPAQECQREGAEGSILTMAKNEPVFRQEIFVQVLKQLAGNPSVRSAHLGWALLENLCREAGPHDELDHFVRAFVMECIRQCELGDELGASVASMGRKTLAFELKQRDSTVIASAKNCLDALGGPPLAPAAGGWGLTNWVSGVFSKTMCTGPKR